MRDAKYSSVCSEYGHDTLVKEGLVEAACQLMICRTWHVHTARNENCGRSGIQQAQFALNAFYMKRIGCLRLDFHSELKNVTPSP